MQRARQKGFTIVAYTGIQASQFYCLDARSGDTEYYMTSLDSLQRAGTYPPVNGLVGGGRSIKTRVIWLQTT